MTESVSLEIVDILRGWRRFILLFLSRFWCSRGLLAVPGLAPKNFDDQPPGQGRLQVHGGQDKRGQGDPPQGEEVDSRNVKILLGC